MTQTLETLTEEEHSMLDTAKKLITLATDYLNSPEYNLNLPIYQTN